MDEEQEDMWAKLSTIPMTREEKLQFIRDFNHTDMIKRLEQCVNELKEAMAISEKNIRKG